jgi:hypothetical protein
MIFAASTNFQDTLTGGGKLLEFGGWPQGSAHQFAAAIGAPVVQNIIGTGFAKGAFKAADQGDRSIGRQVDIAALTVGTQFQHDFSSGFCSRSFVGPAIKLSCTLV